LTKWVNLIIIKKMEKRNLAYLMKKYGPGFLAISKRSGRVMVSGRSLAQVWKKAEEKDLDFSKIEIMHVPRYETVKLYRISL